MEGFVRDLNDASPIDQNGTDPQEAIGLSIQGDVQPLVHACQCHDENCALPRCQDMKRVIEHVKSCEYKISGGCQICEQFIPLCSNHAKHCLEPKCLVPLCLNIKHKLKQLQLQEKLEEAKIHRNQFLSALRVIEQEEMPPSQMQSPMGQIGSGSGSHLVPIDHWAQRPTNPALQQNPGIRQPNPQMMQSQQVVPVPSQQQTLGDTDHTHFGPELEPNMQRLETAGGSTGGNSSDQVAAVHRQALQQLSETLKSPHTPGQQQQVRDILKSNPQLLAAFIRQRQAFELAQAAQNQAANAGQNISQQQGGNVPMQALKNEE